MKAITLTALLALATTASGATVQRIAKNSGGFAVSPDSHQTSQQASGAYLGATSSSLGCLLGGADPNESLKGMVVGCTYHDLQKYGSMGRQIASDQIFGTINYSWTNKNNNVLLMGRDVCYEGFYGGAIGDGTGAMCTGYSWWYPIDPNERSGFTTLAEVGDGTALMAFEWNRIFLTDPDSFVPYVFKNETPGLGDFVGFGGVGGTGRLHDSLWSGFLAGDATAFIWPQIAYTDFGGTQVAHLVVSSNRTDGDNTALYLRRVGFSDWETVMELGPAGFHRSFVVSNSRISERVGIAFSGGRGDGTPSGAPISRYNGLESGQNDNDLYLILSNDAGATWGSLQNITQRPDSTPGTFTPHAKLSALFDANDDFNVVWQARRWEGYDSDQTTLARIYSWNEGTGAVRVAADGVWNSIDCLPGFQQLNIDNPQLSECASKLFLTFNMFAPASLGLGDDCAERAFSSPSTRFGAANADIYVTTSDNNGFNWDPPRNLTQTYTPNCDTFPGGANPDCGNEVWHSVTRYGIDVTLDNYTAIPDFTDRLDGSYVKETGEYLFVQYIDDTDPGAAPQGEGGWHDNPVRSFRFGCVDKVGGCLIATNIAEGQAVDDPTFAPLGAQVFIDWELRNQCPSLINYALSIDNQIPTNNVTVTGADGVIDAGTINWDSLVITLNASLETVPQHAHAEITLTGNFLNGQTAGTMVFNIDYTIGDIQQKTSDSIASCLIYDNRGNIGDQATSGLSFDLQGAPAECDTNAVSYLFEGSPIVSYAGDGAYITVSSMFNTGFVDSFTFRPQTEPTSGAVVNDPGAFDDGWIRGNSGEFTTQDSALGFTVDYWTPGIGDSELSDDWKVVFARVCMTNRTASQIPGAYLAYGWDWDVPAVSQAQNLSDHLPTFSMMYQQGAQDTSAACLDYDRRFAAVRYFPSNEIDDLELFSTGGGAGVAGFQSMYTRDNVSFVGAEWNHRALDSMLQNIVGFDKFAPTDPELLNGTDIHMVLNGGAYDLDPGDTVYLHFAMLTGIAGDNTTTDLEGIGATLEGWSPWTDPSCCDVPGDADNDGIVSIGDAVFLIDRIFRGGPPAVCCAEADADASGGQGIGDLTYIIAYIFSGQPPPTCGEAVACGER